MDAEERRRKYGKKGDPLGGYSRKCPICKKEFFITQDWVYVTGYSHTRRYYCSWHCLRENEKRHMSLGEKIAQAIRDGLNDGEIKRLLNCTQGQIDYRRERVYDERQAELASGRKKARGR